MDFAFDSQEIPNLCGKVFYITGGTIYTCGRNAQAANFVIEQLRSVSKTDVTFVKCDLASFSSVMAAATDFLTKVTRLDALLCNPGIMAIDPGLTKEGYKIQFGTILICNFLLLLQRTADDREGGADAHIVMLTSLGYKIAPRLVEGMGAVKRWFVYITNLEKIVGPEDGVYSSLWATTTSMGKDANGAFYGPVRKLGRLDVKVKDEGFAGELCEWT
ncbi:hypothetical protein BJX63DRAFT_425150 [Aspergillus granulosus]|uniref:Uncharacterized protein n=1 Tax=Aspergillus granulosus TaxID=176169 RepID=A0ABR4GXM2_9EURO